MPTSCSGQSKIASAEGHGASSTGGFSIFFLLCMNLKKSEPFPAGPSQNLYMKKCAKKTYPAVFRLAPHILYCEQNFDLYNEKFIFQKSYFFEE
jgi:hypothetical protein